MRNGGSRKLGSQPIRTLVPFLNLTDSRTRFRSLYIVTENVKAKLTVGTDEGNPRAEVQGRSLDPPNAIGKAASEEKRYSSFNSLNNLGSQITVNYLQDDASVYVGNSLFVYFSRFWRWIWIYVFRLGYSNLWSTLCCKCIIKNIKKLSSRIVSMLWSSKIKEG